MIKLYTASLLQINQLVELCNRLARIHDGMPNCSRITENLKIISTLKGLVTKEVNCLVLDTMRHVLFILDVLEAICLVPAFWEDVERNVSSDRVSALVSHLTVVMMALLT